MTNKWQEAAGAPHASITDVEPQILANFNDMRIVIFAFQGDPLPFGCPDDPCRDDLANPCPSSFGHRHEDVVRLKRALQPL